MTAKEIEAEMKALLDRTIRNVTARYFGQSTIMVPVTAGGWPFSPGACEKCGAILYWGMCLHCNSGGTPTTPEGMAPCPATHGDAPCLLCKGSGYVEELIP